MSAGNCLSISSGITRNANLFAVKNKISAETLFMETSFYDIDVVVDLHTFFM